MKTLLILAVAAALTTGCAGPGGPAERTGRSVDHGVETVGHGVEKTGEKIQDVAH